ncbi:MAG: hypothetical protein JSV52_03880 [Candidatus Zixiibacteriota bacterium]|nr:MAG: hypothetical protein JSV52_03880 [candidate division Zixibacteria bacterium]
MEKKHANGKRFSKEEAEKIGGVLGADKIAEDPDKFRLKLINHEERRTLSLEIFPETSFGKTRGMLVVVYTGNSHLQLHNCTGYVISGELGEVTFVSESGDRLSGLVVERGASCSLYAALNKGLISSDFTQLGVEVMLSGVALSLAEDILSDEKKK